MSRAIRSVMLVSDGILVEFADSTRCYYAAEYLENQIGIGSNQVFLSYDPSLVAQEQMPELPSRGVPMGALALVTKAIH